LLTMTPGHEEEEPRVGPLPVRTRRENDVILLE
jgi:hypothetical protein